MDPTIPPAPRPSSPSDNDSLLEELAELTGLFTPEQIWQKEEKLDDMDEAKDLAQDAASEPA